MKRLQPRLQPAQRQLDHMPQLLELYTQNAQVAKLLRALARQENLGSDITVARVEEMLRCSRRQAIQTMRELGKTKVVRFILGRHRGRTRLEWHKDFWEGDEIAKKVLGEVAKYIDELARKAAGDDEEAQDKLNKMATEAGLWQEDVDTAESWATVAKVVAPCTPEGREALGSEETPVAGPAELRSLPGIARRHQNPEEPKFVDTKILLRPDLWVILSLPQDLTENEAERLAGVVRNLWLVPSKATAAETSMTNK